MNVPTGAMRIAVVGGGPAGVTAAHHLQGAGHRVTVLERTDAVGGRTHTEHLGDGHWLDTGAGWLASFYPDTLALLDELGLRDRLLRPLSLRGGGDLLLDGRLVPAPNSVARIVRSPLVGVRDKARFVAYVAGLLARQPGDLRVRRRDDAVTALAELAPIGAAARDRIVRPNFEGPFFARLESMSAALVRSWLRCLSVGSFFQVDGGMDRPWREIADRLDVRTGVAVERIERRGSSVSLSTPDGTETYDAVVVAVPAPVAARIVAESDRPAALAEVGYVPHVRVYAARHRPGGERIGWHVFPNELVATIEQGDGRHGSWGRVPPGWEWALVCAPAAASGPLLELSEQEATERLWAEASRLRPGLLPLAEADVVHLVRWEHAVPDVGVGYYARLAGLAQAPPIVFAGDWLQQPCVEGAVRSGLEAARLLGVPVAPTPTIVDP